MAVLLRRIRLIPHTVADMDGKVCYSMFSPSNNIKVSLTVFNSKTGPPPPGYGHPAPPPSGGVSFGHGAPQGYQFQYSKCTGRRKALLIGINYFGQKGQLRGCINDVKNMSSYLNQAFGYAREDMVLLTDDQQNPMSQPTKANILRAMHWLVKDAQPNDSLFFHYSGKLMSFVKAKKTKKNKRKITNDR